jgi:murein DD-endopeptidase MepM/ murein hydrolase activator NlpD
MTVNNHRLESVLRQMQGVRIIPCDLNREHLVVFDFSRNNPELHDLDVSDTVAFSRYISRKLEEQGARVGIGKYNENRTIYDKSAVFASSGSQAQRRTLHLGMDLWVAPGTPVLAALDGQVHSFQDNRPFGDYGPTIILKHTLNETTFFTLYGHLNRDCLKYLQKNQIIRAGQEIALVGDIHENGQWPPHLHFEIIRDLQGNEGDFPGVCAVNDREKYLDLCPDPNLLLGIKILE